MQHFALAGLQTHKFGPQEPFEVLDLEFLVGSTREQSNQVLQLIKILHI